MHIFGAAGTFLQCLAARQFQNGLNWEYAALLFSRNIPGNPPTHACGLTAARASNPPEKSEFTG